MHSGNSKKPGNRPYGGWPSPLEASAIAAGATNLSELRASGDNLYWLASRPAEGGRTTLLRYRGGVDGSGRIDELTNAPISVRSRVHEYGGGSYLPTTSGIFFVDDRDGDVYQLIEEHQPIRLTEVGRKLRFADFCWDARRGRLIAVCERAQEPRQQEGARQPENLLVALPVGGAVLGPEDLEPLHRGHDFYAAPRLDPTASRLAFVAWDHPNMPWDGTQLLVAELDPAGKPIRETVIAGGSRESVQQPLWTDDGGLVFASDANGFWNPYRYDESGLYPLIEDGAEYAEAPWNLGQSTLASVGPDHLLATRFSNGAGELVLLDSRTGFAAPVQSSWLEYESLCSCPGGIAFIGRRGDGPPAIVHHMLADGQELTLHFAEQPPLAQEWISHAEPLAPRARDGAQLHALFYPPTNPDWGGPTGGLPPLLVSVHGGPTARSSAALGLRTQYFTTRGWAVLEVDYRGSSGYGRGYRQALNGRWGELDVADCEDAARALVNTGRVDPDRIAIRGSSAGGMTVLASLAASGLFRAGTSLYGIGDLAALARDTHKFESHYTDTLVGDLATCTARSPINQVARIVSPVLLLQGTLDRVVPPSQALAMIAALRARRVPAELIEFEGEGHGFRMAHNIERALEYEYAFYCRVFEIQAATPPPPLEIGT